jgi:hypothetical protein
MKLYDLDSLLNVDTNYQLKTTTLNTRKIFEDLKEEMTDGPLQNFFTIPVKYPSSSAINL